MAYLVTEYSQKPDSFKGAIKKIIRDFIAAVRVALLRMGVVNLNSLTPADLAALARYAISTTTNLKPISNKLVINGRNSGAAMASVYAPEGMADMPDYEKQYQAIEAKYFNTDGSEKPGAMLAPNGERSKLNKMQWIQVRTQAFKDWFGDWETEAAINELTNGKPLIVKGDEFYDFSEPVNMDSAREKTREYAYKNVIGAYRNNNSGLELEIRKGGIDETISHGGAPDKLKAFVATPELIKNGFVVYDGINPKNTRNRLVTISKHVEISGKLYAVTAGFREDANGRLIYDHELLDVSRADGFISQRGEGIASQQPLAESARLNDYYRRLVGQKVQSSKVTDTNGEPMVVYHGSGADFTEFDKSKIGSVFEDDEEGFFFTNNTTHTVVDYGNRLEIFNDMVSAGAYAKNAGGNANIMPVFIALKSPVIIDSVNEPNGFDGQDVVTWLEHVLGKKSIISQANENSNDGVIVTDRSVEFGKNGDNEKLVVAFNPNQIKSATGNTGAFRNENNDIRYSIAPKDIAAPNDSRAVVEKKDGAVIAWIKGQLPDKDTVIYNYQDRMVDMLRHVQKVQAKNGDIDEAVNPYLAEELYSQRAASRVDEFYDTEFKPLLKALHSNKISFDDFQEFLHARHAPSRNKLMAQRNPSQAMIDQERMAAKDGLDKAIKSEDTKAIAAAKKAVQHWQRAQAFKGTEAERLALSGVSDAQAQAMVDKYPPSKRLILTKLGDKVDKINNGTLDLLVAYNMETPETVAALKAQWQHYVPLHRDEAHPDGGRLGHPVGQGYNIKGSGLKKPRGQLPR
ncbi:MAG: hypothetical protein ABL933_17260 [Methyloglobulus sp.]|nr:hypothetical protein [Methyloglobulus sp.]